MFTGVPLVRHGAVAVVVLVVAALGAFRVVGAGEQSVLRPEHFDHKRVVVSPAGSDRPDGLRIEETVDMDVGGTERRGYQRILSNDFGVPTDVVASSPDAEDDLDVVSLDLTTRIRVGDPDVTFTGQRRFELGYTLPSAGLTSGRFVLDVIGNDETFRTDRFEVVVVGMRLSDVRCDVGARRTQGGCELVETSDDVFTAVFEPLAPGDGITIGATVDERTTPAEIGSVPFPPRHPTGPQPLGYVLLLVGAATALGGYLLARGVGSNEVFGAGGAADAAFGRPGAQGSTVTTPDVATMRLPDSRLGELATIEFVPPAGIEPWQGNVLLRERLDDEAVTAWFSEMIARGHIEITRSDTTVTLRRGDATPGPTGVDATHLAAVFARGDRVTLGEYDRWFAAAWTSIRSEQQSRIQGSGWWSRPIPGANAGLGRSTIGAALGAAALLFVVGPFLWTAVTSTSDRIGSVVPTLVAAVFVVGLAAFLAYRILLPSRTASGSALALRTESFRRFLASSEGRHVEWAWQQGLVREYSAWAVALGAADAWSDAISAARIPDPGSDLSEPLVLHTFSSTFASTLTAPSSSGSGGGGFSGGGGVGGGGGGGSSGSW